MSAPSPVRPFVPHPCRVGATGVADNNGYVCINTTREHPATLYCTYHTLFYVWPAEGRSFSDRGGVPPQLFQRSGSRAGNTAPANERALAPGQAQTVESVDSSNASGRRSISATTAGSPTLWPGDTATSTPFERIQ